MADQPDDWALKVLEVMNLPWTVLTTFEDKREGMTYAAVLKGGALGAQGWCHDPDKANPPFFFHRTEEQAWACFDEHHPGLRDAIAKAEAHFAKEPG